MRFHTFLRNGPARRVASFAPTLPRQLLGSLLVCLLVAMSVPAHSSELLLKALESQYPRWRDSGGEPPVGIVVLGGGMATYLLAEKTGVAPFGPGERIAAGITLSKRFPSAKLLFSGGGEPNPIAAATRSGVDPSHIFIEPRSRNTAENAALAARLVHPRPGDRWILVTSAYHMPRAMGAFQAAGFHVEAYPVDFGSALPDHGQGRSVKAWNEILGILAYRLSGKIGASSPGP